MTEICAFCGFEVTFFTRHRCYYCKRTYCLDHKVAEIHECPPVVAAKVIEKDQLREKGVNITTGRFAVACYQCDYISNYSDILESYQNRLDHIKNNGCLPAKVWLKRHPDDLSVDRGQFIKSYSTVADSSSRAKSYDWMYDCLEEAKDVIKKYHTFCNCDPKSFFRTSTYDLYVQKDRENAYAYINLMQSSRHFPIGVHPSLSVQTSYNQRALVVVLVHELLHSIHTDWGHDRINPQEKLLANKANYFDALVELERLAFSGKMRLCNN